MKHCSINFDNETWACVERVAKALKMKKPDVIRNLILRFSDALIEQLELPAKK